MREDLYEANKIVKQHLVENFVHSIDLLKPDLDDEFYFYNESPLTVDEIQENNEELSFIIRTLQWNELADSFDYIDFYFSSDSKSINYDIEQGIDEMMYDLMKELMKDKSFVNSLQPFVVTELRERKLKELSI